MILLIGGDPTDQAPLTAWNIRTNVRNNKAKVFIANHEEIKLRRQAKAFIRVQQFGYGALANYLAGDDSAAAAASVSAQADELERLPRRDQGCRTRAARGGRGQ